MHDYPEISTNYPNWKQVIILNSGTDTNPVERDSDFDRVYGMQNNCFDTNDKYPLDPYQC